MENLIILISSWVGSILIASAYTFRAFPKYIVFSKVIATIGSAMMVIFGLLTSQYQLVFLYINAFFWSAFGGYKWYKDSLDCESYCSTKKGIDKK